MRVSGFQKIVFLVGPTGVGKTEVALYLANRWPCEIVCCDSMQVYREVSIANSKPTKDERQKVGHHLLDVVSVDEKFDVAAFNKSARLIIDKLIAGQKNPLVVGGSGMYMQVLLDGIFESGDQNVPLREKLQQRITQEGPEVLYQDLKKVDPHAAAKIHAHDSRRIVRALEVFETTQTPISQLQKNRLGLWGRYPIVIFGLDRRRDELYQRINARVETMFADGLIDEVKALADRNLSLTSSRIIGVKEVLGYLKGESSLEATKQLIKKNTRNLAKRQLTWFRKDKRIRWILVDQDQSALKIADQILKEI